MNKYSIKYLRYLLGIVAVLCFTPLVSNGQQEWGYTQYLFNLYDINSAYAGNHGAGSFGVRYRSQWIGMPGSPETRYLSFHTPIFNGSAGIGVKILNEDIGLRNQTALKISAAYKIKFEDAILSFGIGGGLLRQGMDVSSAKVQDPQDIQLINTAEPILTPVAEASVFISTKRFYAGVESGSINRSRLYVNEGSLSRLYFNTSLVGGYMLPVGKGNVFQISGLMRYVEGKIWQSEVNALYLVKSRLWFGGGYRIGSNAHAMACFNLTEQLRIGVSYDISTTAIRQFNDGSTEVFLGFNFKSKSNKSIRYF